MMQNMKSEAIVLGNGPSLRGFEFNKLSRFDVFGMNAAYRYWYEIEWFPQYYSCLDLVVGESHRDEIAKLIKNSDRTGIRAFLLRQALIDDLGEIANSSRVFNFDLLCSKFECLISKPVTTGSHTCAWAATLGYEDIYLLGVDCNYLELVHNAEHRDGSVLEIIEDGPSTNYFFDSYQKKGDKYNIPNPRKNLHLDSWRNVKEKLPPWSRVFNANLASRVDVFPFVRFKEVVKGGKIPFFLPSQVFKIGCSDKPTGYIMAPCSTEKDGFLKIDLPLKTDETHEYISKLPSILAYNGKWQSDEFTEKYALSQAIKLLPEVPGIMYFGFPWTMLIDQEANTESGKRLMDILEGVKPLLKQQKCVVTVCQHDELPEYQDILEEMGVTHVFWPHTGKRQESLYNHKNLKVCPFPFATIQVGDYTETGAGERKYLFSLIQSNEAYLSNIIETISRHLAEDKRGLVIIRDQLNFGRICDEQVRNLLGTQKDHATGLSRVKTSRILQDSVFSLFPYVKCLNSPQLWETINCGAIPVIFGDLKFLPGRKALWEEATVACSERLEDILTLPDRLMALYCEEKLLEKKRNALKQLSMLYGRDCFIYDIQKLFLSFAQDYSSYDIDKTQKGISYGRLLAMAAKINHREKEKSDFDIFILGCSSRVLSDPKRFKKCYKENKELRLAIKEAMNFCNQRLSDNMLKNMSYKGIVSKRSDKGYDVICQ